MRKIILGIAFLLGIISCGIETPSSVTIKGKPSVHIPLGSPFTDENRLEDSFSRANIKTMMDGDKGARLYDYLANTDVQTYLTRYPIAEMKLDLTEYMNDIIKDDASFSFSFVNPYPGDVYLTPSGPGDDPDEPLFKVDISNMAKLVTEVNGGPFGIEVSYSEYLEKKLLVRIPAFGFDYYKTGTVVDDKLRFDDYPAFQQFKPTEYKNGIEIYMKVIGTCYDLETIKLEMVFEWKDAVVDTAGEPMEGKYAISNSLREYLGENVTFKRAGGYIFVDGIENGGDMSLRFDGGVLLEPASLHKKPFPDQLEGDDFIGQLPTDSLEKPEPIDMTEVMNNQLKSTLEYVINIGKFTIYKYEQAGTKNTITADLVIMLPLEFEVANAPSDPIYLPSGYVKLELGNIFPEPGGGDLFFRTGENENLIDQHIRMKIFLTNINNTIIDDSNLSILVYSEDERKRIYEGIIKFSDENPNTQFVIDKSFPNPFSPRFHTILEKDDNKDYATFIIKRPRDSEDPIFDFHLNAEVKADLNYVQDL